MADGERWPVSFIEGYNRNKCNCAETPQASAPSPEEPSPLTNSRGQ